MNRCFDDVFGHGKILIGVVHLLPLPGSPGFSGDLGAVLARAVGEAELLEKAGFGAVIVENFGDLPFLKTDVGPEVVASMAIIAREIKRSVAIPVGINVLRNDYEAALAVAATSDCQFVRINILVGAFATTEGLIEGAPGRVLRSRQRIAPHAMIMADVLVKHAYPLAATTIGDDALDVAERGGADCLIVTGSRTGKPPSGGDLRAVRSRLEEAGLDVPVLVGSGVTPAIAGNFLKLSRGLIVGSYIRKQGKAGQEIETRRARRIGQIKNRLED